MLKKTLFLILLIIVLLWVFAAEGFFGRFWHDENIESFLNANEFQYEAKVTSSYQFPMNHFADAWHDDINLPKQGPSGPNYFVTPGTSVSVNITMTPKHFLFLEDFYVMFYDSEPLEYQIKSLQAFKRDTNKKVILVKMTRDLLGYAYRVSIELKAMKIGRNYYDYEIVPGSVVRKGTYYLWSWRRNGFYFDSYPEKDLQLIDKAISLNDKEGHRTIVTQWKVGKFKATNESIVFVKNVGNICHMNNWHGDMEYLGIYKRIKNDVVASSELKGQFRGTDALDIDISSLVDDYNRNNLQKLYIDWN